MQPPWKRSPLFPSNPLQKLRSCQVYPFWKFGRRFNSPPSRNCEGAHYVPVNEQGYKISNKKQHNKSYHATTKLTSDYWSMPHAIVNTWLTRKKKVYYALFSKLTRNFTKAEESNEKKSCKMLNNSKLISCFKNTLIVLK